MRHRVDTKFAAPEWQGQVREEPVADPSAGLDPAPASRCSGS